jgi:hypothetical protein
VEGAIDEDSFRTWHKEMLFQPGAVRENFMGLDDEAEIVGRFFDLLPGFLADAEKDLFS